jgi:hypothetical protein
LRLAEIFQAKQIRHALIGGVATAYRSRPRFTRDLDFLVTIPQLVMPGLLDELQHQGFTVRAAETMREWSQHHMAQLSFRGIRVDWLEPVLPLFQHVIDKAPLEDWLGQPLRIATPEGLILTKLIAFRSQDQTDIEGLLAANRQKLDRQWIEQEWLAVADAQDSRYVKFLEMYSKIVASS